jgi:hypothetical protein
MNQIMITKQKHMKMSCFDRKSRGTRKDVTVLGSKGKNRRKNGKNREIKNILFLRK